MAPSLHALSVMCSISLEHQILQLEMNEIPWRFLNSYRGRPDFPHIEKFFQNSKCYTSLVVDGGEMSPWVVWPTFHRGMNEKGHHIHSIGQDPSTFGGVPIWEEVRRAGKNIGIFGPLQSWPPTDPGLGGFYVPDTFAADSRCIPASLNPLQEFNLSLVNKNIRVRRGSFFGSLSWSLLAALPGSGIRIATLARIAGQLALEKIDSRYCARRTIYQNILFWDVFKSLFNHRDPPAYSSYFSNHLASAMHRYWNYAYPEDFPPERRPKDDFHKGTLNFAMQVLDDMLADVLSWMSDNPRLTVIFASGLGQDTYVRGQHEGTELAIRDVSLLLKRLGLPDGSFTPLIAMMPQVAVRIPDAKLRAQSRASLESLACPSGLKPMETKESGDSLSLSVSNPRRADIKAGGLTLNGEIVPFAELGMEALEVEAGTAYHIPEAIFAIAGAGAEKFSLHWKEPTIPGDRIKAELLHLLDLKDVTAPQA